MRISHLIQMVLALVIIPAVSAVNGQMVLLAVSETPAGPVGSVANLELTILPGVGRVFIDSYPLTKVDTQISTRFARQIACNQLNLECGNLDFFYVIRANSTIVGGPSAGAALTILTMLLLENKKPIQGVAITGTINSGGFIGHVGGLKQKVEAASRVGISKVLVPRGSRMLNESNSTIDLVEYGASLGVKVIEVTHVEEAIPIFMGRDYSPIEESELEIDPIYGEIMEGLAKKLCTRTQALMKQAILLGINSTEMGEALNLSKRGAEAINKGALYSGASFCFGANTRISQLIAFKAINISMLGYELIRLKAAVLEFEAGLPKYSSLTDLETYTLVIERLAESKELIERSYVNLIANRTRTALADYGYAKERYYSAVYWSEFFGSSKEVRQFNQEEMASSCIQKLAEAKERLNYLGVYLPEELLEGISEELGKASGHHGAGEQELCLFRAAKAKAQADSIIMAMGSEKQGMEELLQHMLPFIRRNIAEQTKKGHFPIVGYSYYEYSKSLRETELASALLYAQYALELSNLDMYFKNPERRRVVMYDPRIILCFSVALILGIALGYTLARIRLKNHSGPRGTRSGKKR